MNAADVVLAVKFAGSTLNLPAGPRRSRPPARRPLGRGGRSPRGPGRGPAHPGPRRHEPDRWAPTGGYAVSGVVDLTALAPVRQAALTDMASILLADLDGDGVADDGGVGPVARSRLPAESNRSSRAIRIP